MSQIPGSCKGESNQDFQQSPPAEQARLIARSGKTDPDLAHLIEAWPGLPDALKAGNFAGLPTTIYDPTTAALVDPEALSVEDPGDRQMP